MQKNVKRNTTKKLST